VTAGTELGHPAIALGVIFVPEPGAGLVHIVDPSAPTELILDVVTAGSDRLDVHTNGDVVVAHDPVTSTGAVLDSSGVVRRIDTSTDAPPPEESDVAVGADVETPAEDIGPVSGEFALAPADGPGAEAELVAPSETIVSVAGAAPASEVPTPAAAPRPPVTTAPPPTTASPPPTTTSVTTTSTTTLPTPLPTLPPTPEPPPTTSTSLAPPTTTLDDDKAEEDEADEEQDEDRRRRGRWSEEVDWDWVRGWVRRLLED
jgi:hypothetical protein